VFGARSFWPAAAGIAYVGVTASLLGGGALALLGSLLLVLAFGWVWRKTAAAPGLRTRIIRASAFGLAVWLSARLGPAGSAALDAAANAGTGVLAVTGLVAIARIPSSGGMLAPSAAARSLDAALLTGFLWAVATALPATYALLPGYRVLFDPLAIDYATTAAAIVSLVLSIAAHYRFRVLRRLELGVGDRAAGSLALSITAFAVSVPAAALDLAAPDRVLPVAVVAGAALSTWASTIAEPTTVSSALRGILAVTILGTPVMLSAGLLARAAPSNAGSIVLGSSALAIAVGLLARAVARPLGPEQSRWLAALDAASRGALQPEPDAALTAALRALSEASRSPTARAEIWRNHPSEVLSVDVAGYLHIEPGDAPERLYLAALEEPERTLRADVLHAAEVRRPEVRGVRAWFDARDAFSATVVTDDDGPVGFILLPRAGRTSLMTLEEARAARVLADRISALLSVTSALARARNREIAAASQLAGLERERDRLALAVAGSAARHRAMAERYAERVRSTAYAPASRLTLDVLERAGKSGASLTLVTPPGVAATNWAAHAHLASARHGGPFVVCDATAPAERTLDRWNDPEHSPIRLADGGTLVLLDPDALPFALQEHIARAIAERRLVGDDALVPPALFVSSHAALEPLVALGKLAPGIRRLIGLEIELPPLAERAEDLRALVLEGLARVSLRAGREPLGMDAAALRLLVEHTWPGNDLELESLLVRAVRITRGTAITPEELAAVGFEPKAAARPEPTPIAPPTRRRAPRRWARK
jgi:transcriptional regulator with AAA-type ATPase domain